MGMFDSIYPPRVWCPYCGSDMVGNEFQTKDGDCDLVTYRSWEEFGETIPDRHVFKAYAKCQVCSKWVELLVKNESKAHKEWMTERR